MTTPQQIEFSKTYSLAQSQSQNTGMIIHTLTYNGHTHSLRHPFIHMLVATLCYFYATGWSVLKQDLCENFCSTDTGSDLESFFYEAEDLNRSGPRRFEVVRWKNMNTRLGVRGPFRSGILTGFFKSSSRPSPWRDGERRSYDKNWHPFLWWHKSG